MSSLNELIINELQRTEVKDISRLINYMKGERGFFWVRSGEHDHWTNGVYINICVICGRILVKSLAIERL